MDSIGRYAKAIVCALVMVLMVVANKLGVDLGTLGADIDVTILVQGIVATIAVFGVRNKGT